MARITIESQAAPAAQGPVEHQLQKDAAAGALFLLVLAALQPGLAIGAFAAYLWRSRWRPSAGPRVVAAVVPLVSLWIFRSNVTLAWSARLLASTTGVPGVTGVKAAAAIGSLCNETLAGPIWLELWLLAMAVVRRRPDGQVAEDQRLHRQRWRALAGGPQGAPSLPASLRFLAPQRTHDRAHPLGQIRLGIDGETDEPFDLALPRELATHLLVVGAQGSGKTTTVATVADGALTNRHSATFVDCKGGSLGQVARDLARRHGVPFYLVDPDDPESLGYDICAGDPAAVANKLIGAFTFAPTGEIYKNIAMEAIPVVVQALHVLGEPVTLRALYDAFGPRGLTGLAHRVADLSDQHGAGPGHRQLAEVLLTLGERGEDRTGRGGHAGLRHRFGALLHGKFGHLFEIRHALDWERALERPSVVYIALSALASSEDVELMGRVVAQDLKQVCARRLRRLARGEELAPALAIFDEFAALREAEQLTDLLLQARQALMPVCISTQYLPESVPLRRSVFGAGLLIAHRVEGEDAEAIANQFGTRRATEVTDQADWTTGYSDKGSIRRVEQFNVHPNQLRTFVTGQAAVKSVPTRRYTIVRVNELA